MPKSRFQRAVAEWADRHVPPVLLKHHIALRNWRRGEAELRLLPALVAPHRLAVDVGAHRGAYTYFLARLCRGVHAFEPQPRWAEFLRRAYGANVTVHACALAEASGRARLSFPGAATQSARLDGPGPDGIEVDVRRLDDFGLDDVGFVKIDAEGAELRVLRGATGTLARCRPRLLVEVEARHVQGPIDVVFTAIEDLGYRGRYWYQGRWHPACGFSFESLQYARLRGDRRQAYINNFVFDPV
jgi:FkbM family methyltransferase